MEPFIKYPIASFPEGVWGLIFLIIIVAFTIWASKNVTYDPPPESKDPPIYDKWDLPFKTFLRTPWTGVFFDISTYIVTQKGCKGFDILVTPPGEVYPIKVEGIKETELLFEMDLPNHYVIWDISTSEGWLLFSSVYKGRRGVT